MNGPRSLDALHAAPAAGFDQPFEMLAACHERVHRMLALLGRLREHVAAHGADAQAQQAARDVMRYFDVAAPHHHQDEELHVFPVLLAQGDARTVQLVRRLQDDHLRMESGWTAARAVLQEIAAGTLQRFTPSQAAVLETFGGLYGEHIEAEEGTAYPGARALLDDAALRAAGAEMARRRGAA